MVTYTYEPLVGITSQCDANNRVNYYQYDKTGRLILIRDQDRHVVKKYCYNYIGQPEDCSTPCINSNADWQNTATATRCQVSNCAFTGYEEQEQMDMNTCSGTYGTKRWVQAAYNPTNCPTTTVFATITYQNFNNQSGFTATYTSTTNGKVYSFIIPTSPNSGTLGCLPVDKYTLTISKPGNTTSLQFGCQCATMTGTSATFTVNLAGPSCRMVTIGYEEA